MVVHTVESMTWVWQALSDAGIAGRELELLKNLRACA
jgi:hypothetical protein